MIDIKAACGLSAFDALYIFANDAGQPFAWVNWAANKAFSQNGNWSYFTNGGLSVNTVSGGGFLSSMNIATDFMAYQQNNASYGLKIGANTGSWGVNEHPFVASSGGNILSIQNTANSASRLNSNTNTNFNTTLPAFKFSDAQQYSIVNRISSADIELYANGALLGVFAQASTGVPNVNLTLGVASGVFTRRFTLLHFGRALTGTEISDLDTAFNNYLANI